MSINIAILGYGTVASGLPIMINQQKKQMTQFVGEEIKISKVLVRQKNTFNENAAEQFGFTLVDNIDSIVNDPTIQIVVELMGRIDPAKSYLMKILRAKKHLVTANKDLIALHGQELEKCAKENNVGLYYEAAVAGGIPILRTLASAYASDHITKLLGILNGTSNFMLTKMFEENWSYDQALSKAQELGYAESDPTNDVEGIDAAYKLAILCQFAFGMRIPFNEISHQGIPSITKEDVSVARQLGYVIKLVGHIEEGNNGLEAEVVPTFISVKHPLASVDDVMNAIFIESDGIGNAMYYGAGAGQMPTATSVLSDIMTIAKQVHNHLPVDHFNRLDQTIVSGIESQTEVKKQYYFAFETPDLSGQFMKIASWFKVEGISFEQILQEKGTNQLARVVIITHEMSKKQVEQLKKHINENEDIQLLNVFNVIEA